MKILYIVPYYKPAYIYGGPIESVSKLCEGMANNGHQVDVYTTTANGTEELPVNAGMATLVDGVNVFYFRRMTKGNTFVSPDLWRRLNRTIADYDVIHIQTWWNLVAVGSALICYLKRARVIVSPRGMLSSYIINSGQALGKKIIHQSIGKKILSRTWFHATAISEADECRDIIPGWKGFVQPNILTLPDEVPVRQSAKVFTLIFMSRIHPKKGLELLFQAISRLDFEVVLKIAGSGEDDYIVSLKSLAEELGITGQVEWLGWVNRQEKFKELVNADLFVLVSYNENFANVVIESLHVGTAVLISWEVALSDFVKQTDMGWMSDMNVDDLIHQITAARNDADKLDRIRLSGRDVINSGFSPAKLIKEYEREYNLIISA